MIKICFVCLGNICRSPMAEAMFRKLVLDLGREDEFFITSRGTSSEEYGNDIYPPAKEKLMEMGIPFSKHFAKKVSMEDYLEYDYFVCMDDSNVSAMRRMFPKDTNKIRKLLDRDIADPWYTGNFEATYRDLEEGLKALVNSVK